MTKINKRTGFLIKTIRHLSKTIIAVTAIAIILTLLIIDASNFQNAITSQFDQMVKDQKIESYTISKKNDQYEVIVKHVAENQNKHASVMLLQHVPFSQTNLSFDIE